MITEAFTPRNVAKFVVQAVIAGKVNQLTEDAIVNHTEFEKDDTIVDISGSLVGWYVSQRVKPYTDKAVDRTADYIVAKRDARKSKKDNTPEEK